MENQTTESTAVVRPRPKQYGWVFPSLMTVLTMVVMLFLWRENSTLQTKMDYLGQKVDSVHHSVNDESIAGNRLKRSVDDLARKVGSMPNQSELTNAVNNLSDKVESGMNKVSRDLRGVREANKASQKELRELAEAYKKKSPPVVNVQVIKPKLDPLFGAVSADELK